MIPYPTIVRLITYSAIIGIIFTSPNSQRTVIDPSLTSALLNGAGPFELPIFKEIQLISNHLPPETRVVSFISDLSTKTGSQAEEAYYTLQNHIAPILIDPKVGQKIAIVWCSNSQAATEQLNAAGYTGILTLSPGKGLAVKE